LEDIKRQDPTYPAYKKYFMHGISHHLGLGVHDVANVYQPFKAGMVLTVEASVASWIRFLYGSFGAMPLTKFRHGSMKQAKKVRRRE
jgi:Xaa-Pro aminopeptidase